MQQKKPQDLTKTEHFLEELEDLAQKADEMFEDSPTFSTVWEASMAALDQALKDGLLPTEAEKAVLGAYVYDVLSDRYEQEALQKIEDDIQQIDDARGGPEPEFEIER